MIRNDDYDLTRTTTIFHTDSTYLSLQAEGNLNDRISIAAGSAAITEQAQQNSRESTAEEQSYSVQLTYGHPENKSAGNFSAWLAYRQAGRIGSYRPAYKGVGFGERGTEIGVRYQALKNLAFEVVYFNGKKVSRLSPPVPDKDKPKIHKWYFGAEYSF